MINLFLNFYENICLKISKFTDIPVLLARISVGMVFANTGFGKLNSLAEVTQYFTKLGLPFPHLNALFVGSTELFGGICLILGLLTRLVSIPLAITMVVAIILAQLPEVKDIFKFVGLIEWAYLLFFRIFVFYGPGKFSLDYYLIKMDLFKRK
jgi:putative oxidoreductase